MAVGGDFSLLSQKNELLADRSKIAGIYLNGACVLVWSRRTAYVTVCVRALIASKRLVFCERR